MKLKSIKEGLPDTNRNVLVCRAYPYSGTEPDFAVAWFSENSGWNVCCEAIEASNYDGSASITLDIGVTHWCELPKLPKEGEN